MMNGGSEVGLMDWVERLLHVSPDGGSGSFELLFLLVVALLLVGLFMLRAVRGRTRR